MLITSKQRQKSRLLVYVIVLLFACNQLYFVFPFPPAIWRTLIMILNLIVVGIGFKTGYTKTEKFILTFILLVSCYFFAGLEYNDYGFTNMGNMFVGLLSFPALSALARRGALREFDFSIVVVLLTVTSIIYYINTQTNMLRSIGNDTITVNASVVFAMLLPSSLLLRNKKLAIILACVCVFFLLASAKRGNIAAAVIPLLLLSIHLYQANRKSFNKRILLLLVASVAGIWISNLISSNDYLIERYQQTLQGKSSGRDIIYSTMWELWYEKANFMQFLFGYGYDGSIIYGGLERYAHNDWLEVLVDFGLVGFIIYVSIFIGLFNIYKKLKNNVYKQTIIALASVWFVKACISMGFTGETMFILSLPFAYVVGNNYFYDNRQNIISNG